MAETPVDLAALWQFPWPSMEVLIGGKSSIDLGGLQVASLAEAGEFVRAYGFDPSDRHDRRHLHGVLVEAISFIESQLLTPREWERGIRPPDEVLACTDPCHLLVWASATEASQQWRSAWACAVLRVMHTTAHIEGVHRSVDVEAARAQIFERFNQHLWREGGRQLFGGDDCHVELARMEWKAAKTRHSILLKLLHKRDNVAETIYDYVGVRLITKRLCDVMMAVKILRKYHIVIYPNAYPSRARNNLIDIEAFRSEVEAMTAALASGTLTPQQFQEQIATLSLPKSDDASTTSNPHSAASYRSIQLTGRQLIKVPYHRFEWFAKLNNALNTQELEPRTGQILAELRAMVEGWHSVKDSLYDAAFFPFEVQILDEASYEKAQSGEANHDRYKLSQVRAARKRVLARVLELARLGGCGEVSV